MECMRVLFAACDAMTNYGAEVGDAALCRIGQEYAACVLATDLATIHSVRRVFKPRGSFWVLEDTVTMGIVGTVRSICSAKFGTPPTPPPSTSPPPPHAPPPHTPCRLCLR
jgi:hypothetical protein